jgi:hypothetical protein
MHLLLPAGFNDIYHASFIHYVSLVTLGILVHLMPQL